jgi:hypothetical protein
MAATAELAMATMNGDDAFTLPGGRMTTGAAPAVPFTFDDIDVGARLALALLAHVATTPAAPLAYGALLAHARAMSPRDAALGRASTVGIGPKLQIVARFCREHGYPDLSALAVHPVRCQPGPHADGAADPSALAATDWSAAPAQLAADVKAWRSQVPARLKPRAERPADVAWYAWFRSHRAECAQVTAEGKHEIINLVMAGLDPESALRRVLAAQLAYGS